MRFTLEFKVILSEKRTEEICISCLVEQLMYKSKAAKCLRERHDDDCKWDCKSYTHIQMNSYKCVRFDEKER